MKIIKNPSKMLSKSVPGGLPERFWAPGGPWAPWDGKQSEKWLRDHPPSPPLQRHFLSQNLKMERLGTFWGGFLGASRQVPEKTSKTGPK